MVVLFDKIILQIDSIIQIFESTLYHRMIIHDTQNELQVTIF